MADYSHVGQIPDEALTAGSGSNSVKALASMTEQDAKDKMRAGTDLVYKSAQLSLVDNLLGGIANAIAMGFKGIVTGLASGFSSIAGSVKPILDGQLSLSDRADLISPMLHYAAVFMDAKEGWNNTGILPFNHQIGVMRGCRLEQNGIRLLEKGTWDISAKIGLSWVKIVTDVIEWRIVVKRPDGSIFSEARNIINHSNAVTSNDYCSVQIPEGGYLVQVEILQLGAGRGVLGGPAWSRLRVQHITDKLTSTGTGSEESDAIPPQG